MILKSIYHTLQKTVLYSRKSHFIYWLDCFMGCICPWSRELQREST